MIFLSDFLINFIFILFILNQFLNALAAPSNVRSYGNPDEWGPYFQGDIVLSRDVRNGLKSQDHRWENGRVPYQFEEGFGRKNKLAVLRAMKEYDNLTNGCIKFVARKNETDYIFIIHSDKGCHSYVGRIGGRQTVALPKWCINSFGSLLHELYHALGFYHEHARPDRDEYITINLNNAIDGTKGNFQKYGADHVTTFDVGYDYTSLMHYGSKAFSKNGNRTIVTKDIEYRDKIGQRKKLSSKDIEKLKIMYNC